MLTLVPVRLFFFFKTYVFFASSFPLFSKDLHRLLCMPQFCTLFYVMWVQFHMMMSIQSHNSHDHPLSNLVLPQVFIIKL